VRRILRIASTLMIASGLCLLLWALVVWRWQDPFTALYTAYQQHRLETRYDTQVAAYRPLRPSARPTTGTRVSVATEQRTVAREASRYRRSLEIGDPVGRLKVPRLGLDLIVVNGTDHDSLARGPGRYLGSFVPGEGRLIYIAGHRTTYGAPFAHIERLRPGDAVSFEVPYGRFLYRVTSSAIVPADEISRLESRGLEEIALQACHPRFFASHRYIAYARPVRVVPREGAPYSLPARAVN
jgi:sortase A